jgi:hypothetical protein
VDSYAEIWDALSNKGLHSLADGGGPYRSAHGCLCPADAAAFLALAAVFRRIPSNEISHAGKPFLQPPKRRSPPSLPTSVGLQPSQQLSPEETVTMLNEFFEQMIEAVFKNFGHLNRFMGAGLMAPFGALRGRSMKSPSRAKRKALKPT